VTFSQNSALYFKLLQKNIHLNASVVGILYYQIDVLIYFGRYDINYFRLTTMLHMRPPGRPAFTTGLEDAGS
jgi:hypothetical protein